MTPDADVALYRACDRNVADAEKALTRAQAERRAVMLRLHLEGMTYADLEALTGRGHTSAWQELRRARAEAGLIVV